jgi:erythromycin esterase-like protein
MPNQNPLRIGRDMTDPRTTLASFFHTLPVTPRVFALGEPTHGVDAFPSWRNRIFRTLVEEHGFRSIAIESDVIAGMRVNAHVTSNQGTLAEVMQTGFSHGFGKISANSELVEWMRAFNADRQPDDHLRFYGFDAPLENLWAASPRDSLLALHAFLSAHLREVTISTATLEELCGEEARWTNQEAAMNPTKSIGNSHEARQLRLLADDLCTLLQTQTPYLETRAGYWEAVLHARTATGLLRYHAVIADPAPTQTRVTRMLALRDLMMADNLCAIAEREEERGPTLVFAHNLHLQRHLSTMKMRDMNLEWWGAGAQVSARLGHRYAFVAAYLFSPPEIGEPDQDTPEGRPTRLGVSASLLTSQELSATPPQELASRTSAPTRVGYFPLEPLHLSLVDGVLLLEDTT